VRGLKSTRIRLANYGPRNTSDYVVGRSLATLARRQLHRVFPPSLGDLHAVGLPTYSADEALGLLLKESLPESEVLRSIQDEYRAVQKRLSARYDHTGLRCPERWRVGNESARLLYSYIRITQPLHIVETGVANGHSSYCILSALGANDRGHLWSVDVQSTVGGLVPKSLHPRWSLRTSPEPAAKLLIDALHEAAPVHLFIHDSNHSWLQQTFEYQAAARTLAPGGVIMSDDIDKSYGWVDWCVQIGADSIVLFDGGKAMGLLSYWPA
jgi:hypothetical protein